MLMKQPRTFVGSGCVAGLLHLCFLLSTHRFSCSAFKCIKVQLTTNLLMLSAEYSKQWDSVHMLVLIWLCMSRNNPDTQSGFCWASLLISNYSGFSTVVRTDVKQNILLHFSFWCLNKINQPKGFFFLSGRKKPQTVRDISQSSPSRFATTNKGKCRAVEMKQTGLCH